MTPSTNKKVVDEETSRLIWACEEASIAIRYQRADGPKGPDRPSIPECNGRLIPRLWFALEDLDKRLGEWRKDHETIERPLEY